MGQFIIHKDGVFNIYSTIVDAPFFESGLTEDEVKEYIKDEFGQEGLRSLPLRLERAKEKGTSSMMDDTLEKCVACNVAGKNGRHMSYKKFCDKYLTFLAKEIPFL